MSEVNIDVADGALIRRVGPKDAPAIVFLPAFGDTGHCYHKVFASSLSDKYLLIAVDLWGFGASPPLSSVRTVAEFSQKLERLIERLIPSRSFGLVGHSIAGSMAVDLAMRTDQNVFGVFSIEGNLTPADAMFTGRAADFDDPNEFKTSFLDQIWTMGKSSEPFRHYYSSARFADPETMWHLGRNARQLSAENHLGKVFKRLSVPAVYYWSKVSTPISTQEWIAKSGIPNCEYLNAGHWPMVEQPEATALAIASFFDRLC